jgi:CopG family transcriptional regulator / antitoxin EndoAI
MTTKTVNISFQDKLLRDIDRAAKMESRSRSEFLREAARVYIHRRQRWNDLFTLGRELARSRGLTPEDVSEEIRDHRGNARGL